MKKSRNKSHGNVKTEIAKVVTAVLVITLSLTACATMYAENGGAEEAELSVAEAREPVTLLISCVGDVMVHKSQIPSQYDASADRYDYGNNFMYVKKYIERSDLALCNLETTFGGKPYTGYPAFSAPDELAAALKDAGFDVALTANNHMMDKGLVGLKRTVDVLSGSGILSTGSRQETKQPRYLLFDAKGMKIGIIAYTYATSASDGTPLINGSAVSREASALINYFRYEYIDEDLKNIKETADEARAAGADMLILYYHWGEEYQLKSNQWQQYIAEKTVNDVGADIIFASHPHTLQETALIKNEKTGRQVPVFYSMGNFLSNQRTETLNNRYTETGIIAQVSLEYDMDKREILSVNQGAIPIWVEKYKSGGRDVYAVIPLDDELDKNEALAVSGHLGRARKAMEDADGILENH